MQHRIDMSNWVIHFVHARKPENEPLVYDSEGNGHPIPWHVDPNKEARFDLWKIKWSEETLEPDASAFSVLLKILDDGLIQAGWSMRNGKPTIYGDRPACCFTEMPLYALREYAKFRANNNVDLYAIALLKKEFFAAGGRPAIYGLSTPHREVGPGEWPRRLDPGCGIGEDEQYRYVSMNLGASDRFIDWSHEREWRWSDGRDQCSCPGLPIWLADEPIAFSQIRVLVRSGDEVQSVLGKLQEMHDSTRHNYDYPFNLKAIEATRVIAVDALFSTGDGDASKALRLEDVPAVELQLLTELVVDAATVERARAAWKEAVDAAAAAAEAWRRDRSAPDVYGTARAMIANPRSLLAAALMPDGKASVLAGVGYSVEGITGACTTHELGEAEAAVDASIEVFRKHFPSESFYSRTLWD